MKYLLLSSAMLLKLVFS